MRKTTTSKTETTKPTLKLRLLIVNTIIETLLMKMTFPMHNLSLIQHGTARPETPRVEKLSRPEIVSCRLPSCLTRTRIIRYDMTIQIKAHHLEAARRHGNKCPLTFALREATDLPWLVTMNQIRTRAQGLEVAYLLRRHRPDESGVYLFLRQFWNPNPDLLSIDHWLPLAIDFHDLPVRLRTLR